MKLTHIQVFKKIMHEAIIKCFVYKQILFFLLMFCMFRYSYNIVLLYVIMLYYIVVYLKYDVKFTY